jgi:MFS family permease
MEDGTKTRNLEPRSVAKIIIVLLAARTIAKNMETVAKTLRDKPGVRWLVLFIVAFVQATNYYFYDAISPLKRLLEENFQYTSTDFGLFVSVYSIPNVFFLMAIFGGIILDRMGIRRTGFLFVGLMAAGALVTAYGASNYYTSGGFGYGLMSSFLPDYSPELKMMLVGRFLYGLGAETSIVVISKVIVKWFKGKELALAFGLKIGIARLGSFAAFNLSPFLAENSGHWTFAIHFSAVLVVIGLLAFFVYSFYDIKIDRQVKTDRALLKADAFRMKDMIALITNRSFLYVTLLCMTFYSAVFPFQSYAPDFFLNKFGVTLTESGMIASLLSLGTMVFTPLFGLFVDKKGKSATLMIIGSAIIVVVYSLFAFTYFSPYVLMILLGIAFSLVPAAMWPSVAKIVEEKWIGTAYGTMFSIQNLGLWAFPLLIGIILDRTNPGITPEALKEGTASYDYTYALVMLIFLGLAGLVFAFLLKREDKVSGYGLEEPS